MALPPVETWPQRPLLLRTSPKPGLYQSPEPATHFDVNSKKSHDFETDLFKGRFHLAVRYANGAECDPWEEGMGWLAGKNRKVVVYVQGEFKKKLAFDECFFGFVWDRKLTPPSGIGAAMKVCEFFSPGTFSDICNESEPYMLNIIAGGADNVHVWSPDDPAEERLPNDMPVQIPERSGGDMPPFKSMKERARWMHKKHKEGGINASHCYYTPGWTYTFEFYTHLLFIDQFEVHFPIGWGKWKLHLEDYFNGQHYPLIGRTKDGGVLWDLELWHEKTAVKEFDGKNAFDRTAEEEQERQKAAVKKEAAQGPPVEAATPPKGLEKRRPTLEQRIMECSGRGLPPTPDGMVDSDEESLWSCNEEDGAEIAAGIVSGGKCTPDFDMADADFDGAENSADDDPDAVSPAPHKGRASPRSPTIVENMLRVSVPKVDETRVVLWADKRLRAKPKHSASATTKKREIPRGCQVTVLSLQDQWAEVRLPSGQTGWIQGRNLGTNLNNPYPEPQVGVITAKRKRIRSEPVSSKRRHGPYLQVDEEVDVLTVAGGWALIVPTNRPAGWLKLSNMKLLSQEDS